MKVLYIGQFSEGTTSKMRAETIKSVLQPITFKVIDTHIPFFNTNSLFRSLGFRFKMGPLILAINTFIVKQLMASSFDLIWVDKAVFITPKTIKLLKSRTSKLIHFTPDMAFYANQSKLFNESLAHFDCLITTKSKELDFYKMYVSKDKILLTTQGFDKQIHKPSYTFEEKDDAVVFIGLAEPSRLKIAEQIINKKLTLKIVGKGWSTFVDKHKSNENLKFFGDAVYSDDYSKLISSSKFGLGLLSKKFPELHTTRTFEIPACGTALLTERNEETFTFFNEDEVVFYENEDDLVEKITYFLKNKRELENLIESGHKRVLKAGYDYDSIIRELLKTILK